MVAKIKYQIWVKTPVFKIEKINVFYVQNGYVTSGFVKSY